MQSGIVPHWLNIGKETFGCVIAHHHFVAQPLDERIDDPHVHRRHPVDPVGRQVRREHRHRDQQAPQAAGPGIAFHHVAVTDHIGAADLDHPAGAFRRLQGGDQIAQHVADGNRLDAREHPPRTNHHWQTFRQVADHLKRQAAGADNDRRTEFSDRHAALAEGRAGFLPRAQMRG